MTIDEFNSTAWTYGMHAIYCGKRYPIVACDFQEALVALRGVTSGTDEPDWVRCENIDLVQEEAPELFPGTLEALDGLRKQK